MAKFKKRSIAILLSLGVVLLTPLFIKALPIMPKRECHRGFFPEASFLQRLQNPPEPWMLDQIGRDLSSFQEAGIDLNAIEKTYAHLHATAGYSLGMFHYRILDNKLYKFVPAGQKLSDTDNLTEKALKTLLFYTTVPDLDFILCSMDGVPEAYLPSDYYLVANPSEQAPILAQAKSEMESTRCVVLIPDQLTLSEHWFHPSQEVMQANQKISWEEKKEVAIWRGGLSDTGEPTDGRVGSIYDRTPRFRLCQLSKLHPERVDAGFAGLDSQKMEEIITKIGLQKPSLSKLEHLKAKYLPVLDGHMCSYPGFQWRLLSNSVCFKQESNQIQWFYHALSPYVHYIPIKQDMSDLLEMIEWAKGHDLEVQKIVERAREFASQNLLSADAYYYYRLVLTEYAKLQRFDAKALRKQTALDPRWKCIQYRKRLALQKSLHKLCQRAKAIWININPNFFFEI